MAYTRAQRLANLAKARRARWPKHKDESVATNGAPMMSSDPPSQPVGTTVLSFDTFVSKWREIVRSDAVERLEYFITLNHWLDGAPKGTKVALSQTLGYNKSWASSNVRPLKVLGEVTCRSLVQKHGYSWADVVMLVAAKAGDRDRLVQRALRGDDRRSVLNGVFESFKGGRKAHPYDRSTFLRAIDHASPTQVVKWMTEYLGTCSPARATAILRGLSVLTLRSQP